MLKSSNKVETNVYALEIALEGEEFKKAVSTYLLYFFSSKFKKLNKYKITSKISVKYKISLVFIQCLNFI